MHTPGPACLSSDPGCGTWQLCVHPWQILQPLPAPVPPLMSWGQGEDGAVRALSGMEKTSNAHERVFLQSSSLWSSLSCLAGPPVGSSSPRPIAWAGVIHPALVVLSVDVKSLYICTADIMFLSGVHIPVFTELQNCL